jgi:ketosteroid isomerase-like protein
MRKFALTAISLLLASALAATPDRPGTLAASPIVEVERAFAAYSYDHGLREGFRAYSSAGSINLTPNGVVTGQALMTSLFAPRRGPPPRAAIWWPVYAGISESGDLGFTTGPVMGPADAPPPRNANGELLGAYYFTIWRRNENGRWTIVIDRPSFAIGGTRHTRASAITELARPRPGPRFGREVAIARVTELEARLAARAEADGRDALQTSLADNAWITGTGVGPMQGRSEFDRELSRRPPAFAARPLGAGASATGDLVFTYGRVSWRANDVTQQGYYVRLWQQQGSTWRIVVDQTTADTPPPETQPTPS